MLIKHFKKIAFAGEQFAEKHSVKLRDCYVTALSLALYGAKRRWFLTQEPMH
jgi:hypothetical protein